MRSQLCAHHHLQPLPQPSPDRPTVYRFEHVLARELNDEDNDDFIVVKDGLLDFSQLVTSDILLELPIKALCREDCKGLCPHLQRQP